MDLHQVQLHDIDSDGNEILMSPKNRAKDVSVTDMDENYNFGESYLKNDVTLSENLSILNKILTSCIHKTDGNDDGVGFVKVATIIPRGSFNATGYLLFDIIANNTKSSLELCFERDTVNTVNLAYFRYDQSPINAKLVYDNRIRTYTLYIEKTVKYSSIFVMDFNISVDSTMLSIRWENSMYEGSGIVGATAEVTPHSSYIKEGKTAPETTDCFWNDTSTNPSVMKYWDGEKWTSLSVGGGTSTSITIDDVMSDTSTNPVQNKILKEYIDGLKIDVDTTMSETSNNPVANKVIKEYIDKKSSSIDDNNISSETVWSSKKIHDLGWTGTMEEYERDKDNIPDGATVNITDDYDDDVSDGASIDDTDTSKTKTWSSDKISKMLWSGTKAEYELAKDKIPEGTIINITDDIDEQITEIDDSIATETTTWSSKKIKGLMWIGTSEEYENEKNSIPEGALVNITDDIDEQISEIDDTITSKLKTWSSDKIKRLIWSGTSEEYEEVKESIPDGTLVNITDDIDEQITEIDDSIESESTTWSSKKIKGLSWTGTMEEYESDKDNIPEGTTVNITDDIDEVIDDSVKSDTTTWSSDKISKMLWSGTKAEYELAKDKIADGTLVNITDDTEDVDGANIDDSIESDTTTWSSKKIKGLSWTGTMEEYESEKDNIPEGALVNITDDTDEVIDDNVESEDTTWSSKKINELTWTGTIEEYERDKDNIPDGATVNITNDTEYDDIKEKSIINQSQIIESNNSKFFTVSEKIGQLIIALTINASLTAKNVVELFSLNQIKLYSEISTYCFTKDRKFVNIIITTSGVVKIIPMDNIDKNDSISENFIFLFETK